jgi:hypothetical protein
VFFAGQDMMEVRRVIGLAFRACERSLGINVHSSTSSAANARSYSRDKTPTPTTIKPADRTTVA